MIIENDLIAAISTPIGEGAISIVRISGKGAIEFLDNYFEGKKPLSTVKSHTIHLGKLHDSKNDNVDKVLVSVFREPNSYTGEDMVEINCHGGWYNTNLVLKLLIENGARLADPGEFTKRAFLNGKIDLSQAEAIADLISAKSDLAHKASIKQLEGSLSSKILTINQRLINTLSLIELELDFVEENLSFTDINKIISEIDIVSDDLKKISDSYKFGKLFREGVKLVISGKPNVGKSSLLNQLLQENRAITTPIPGTTRDIIEENIIINGALFVITDTAGLRDTIDFVEIEGVKRTYEKLKTADIIMYLIDITQTEFSDDIHFLSDLSQYGNQIILIFNKSDLVKDSSIDLTIFRDKISTHPYTKISAISGDGIDKLKNLIYSLAFNNSANSIETSVVITNERHRSILTESLNYLILAKASAKDNQSGEFIAVDLRAALDTLGKITGKTTPEDILNNIFSNFCVGK